MCVSHPQSCGWAVGGPGPHELGSRLEAGFRGAPRYIPGLRLEDQQPLECALLMQDGRGTRAGQRLCSKRARGRFAYIPRVGAGHMAKLKGSGVGKGRRNPSWKTTESVTAWQQHRMLDGGGVLSGLGPGRDSASGSGSISIPGSQASSVRGPVASGTLFSSSNWLNLASVAFK